MGDTKYKFHKEDGEIIECDRCGSSDCQTVAAEHDDTGFLEKDPNRRPKEYLCRFCYETNFGTMINSHGDNNSIAMAMCQAFNIIFKDKK